MRKQEQNAIEAIARHFSGSWERGESPPDAYLTIARKRVAIEIAAIRPTLAGPGTVVKPRLRFDRVALGLVRRLQTALSDAVPADRTVIVTVTAPIWQPGKTTEALEDIVRRCLTRRSPAVEVTDRIHGNQIRVRLVKGGSRRMSNVIGFVHNPDPDIGVFLDLTQSLIEGVGAKADRRSLEEFAGERWLVVADEGGLSPIAVYRQVYAQLAVRSDFANILAVRAGGRVEALTA